MTRDLFDTVPARALSRPRPASGPIDLGRIKRARELAAQAVLLYGEVYLPLFRRLDMECEARREHEDLLHRVRAIAGG